MKATDFGNQLTALVSNLDKAINAACNALFEKGKGFIDNNDAFGKVSIVEFPTESRIWLREYTWAIGVGVKGSSLFIYILNTDTGNRSIAGSKYSGADYLLPFEECRELTPNKLVTVLDTLEKM